MPTASASTGYTERLASRLRDAEFVSFSCRGDGDALAATGLIARALASIDTPFQATVRPPGTTRTTATDADLVVRIGFAGEREEQADGGEHTVEISETDETDETGETGGTSEIGETDAIDRTVSIPGEPAPASVPAADLARELGDEFDLLLALAGGVAAAVRDARDPFSEGSLADRLRALRDEARERGLLSDRRPGIAVPTADAVDGVAHTTLVHAPVSGDVETARERCGSLADRAESDRNAGRDLASLLACSVVEAETVPPRAASAVERVLRPAHLPENAPFLTLGGYADVLAAAAVEAPGTALALALGYDVREAALSAWRAHARRAHEAVRNARVARYEGLCVARLPGRGDERGSTAERSPEKSKPATAARVPIATAARLLRDFRSPEPVVLAVGDGVCAISSTENRSLGSLIARATRNFDGFGEGTERTAEARFDGDPDELVAAVRAELEGVNQTAGDRDDGGTGDETIGRSGDRP